MCDALVPGKKTVLAWHSCASQPPQKSPLGHQAEETGWKPCHLTLVQSQLRLRNNFPFAEFADPGEWETDVRDNLKLSVKDTVEDITADSKDAREELVTVVSPEPCKEKTA